MNLALKLAVLDFLKLFKVQEMRNKTLIISLFCLYLWKSLAGDAFSGPINLLQLHLFAAANTRTVVDELIENFETQNACKIFAIYGGSGFLQAQIKLSRIGDVYLAVVLGFVDAAIVYDVSRQWSKTGVEVISLSKDYPDIFNTNSAAVVTFTRNRRLAEKLVEFLSSPYGKEVFKKHGYSVDFKPYIVR